jgi:hypothetical protein
LGKCSTAPADRRENRAGPQRRVPAKQGITSTHGATRLLIKRTPA